MPGTAPPSDSTREAILRSLTRGSRTAQALGREVGVQTAATRRHLETLAAAGLVESRFRREGIGRPRKYYALTDAGRELLPRRYEDLLRLLMKAAIRQGGPAGLSKLLQAAADELAEEFAGKVAEGASARERAKAVANVLRDLGFPVEIEERGGRLAIVRRDCVFLQIAKAHPSAVCGDFDTRLLAKLLGEEPTLAGCLPWGDGACRHEIPSDRARRRS